MVYSIYEKYPLFQYGSFIVMYYKARRYRKKRGYIPLVFLFAAFVCAVFSIPRIALAAVASSNTLAYTLPVSKNKTAAPTKTVRKQSIIKEARLKIPTIKVNAIIKNMGVTSGGAMAVPGNRIDVGWYSSGTRPGDIGSAVIGGHNYWMDGTGVFKNLYKLKIGDVISVVDAKGVTTVFVVRNMRTYDANDENTGIFASENGTHLNLITCSGTWDPIAKSFTKRLVIFTDIHHNYLSALSAKTTSRLE